MRPNQLLVTASHLDRLGIHLLRFAVAIVFLWIGALKFVPYEADSITPFVANSPFFSFLYANPEAYREHFTHEGQLDLAKRAWQVANHTYTFSSGLGIVELSIGLLVLAYLVSPKLGLAGAVLTILTPIVTLSFLITTPEAWVANLGDAQFGFPYLSGAGRLVLKDVLMLAGGVLMVADSAKQVMRQFEGKPRESF